MVEYDTLKIIASKFSPAAVRRLIYEGFDNVNDILMTNRSENVSVSNWYQTAYQKLINEYRNEYVYKNAIAEKIIRGRHRFSSNCFFATEFRIRNSIADVVIANGTTTAYEIKTEFDSFDRLVGQLTDYKRVFEHIYVVIPESKLVYWAGKIPNDVGIIVLTSIYTLKVCRKSESNINDFDLEALFSCFRRQEFVTAIKNQFGFIPACRPVELKAICRALFVTLDKVQAHKEFLLALKSRQVRTEQVILLKKAPSALTSALLSMDLSLKEVILLNQVLQEKI